MKTNAIHLKPCLEGFSKQLEEFLAVPIAVGGGMHPKAAALWAYLLAIQQALRVRGDCVEVGVFRGWGSFLPARSLAPEERCVLVDISAYNLEQSRAFLGTHAGLAEAQMVDVLIDSAGGSAGQEIAQKVNRARWIHIDGEHSYAGVIADLDTSARIATNDAVICVDDVDHPLATCINDAMHDWLGRNQSWQLLLRGYNKAYLVSTRSAHDWRRYAEILPEVFERFFKIKTVLASQTSNAGSSYFSYGEPFKDFKYLRVNSTSQTLEEFEGLSARSYLLGETGHPEVLVFGNCQMQVLHYALAAATQMCGMRVNTRYVADVHELDEAGGERTRELARSSVGLITQVVTAEKFPVRSAELEALCGSGLVWRVPSIHFNAYWPNQADLRIYSGSTATVPTDALAYLLVAAGADNESIEAALADPDLYTPEEVLGWHASALERLQQREVHHGLHFSVADLLGKAVGGARLFYTFNHPRKRVLDHVMVQALQALARHFEPRHRDVFDAIVAGTTPVRYDMSTIDFIDFPPLASVRKALAFQEPDSPQQRVYRYARQRATDAIHAAIGIRAELDMLRAAWAASHEEHHAFNLAQIETTCLVPARLAATLGPGA